MTRIAIANRRAFTRNLSLVVPLAIGVGIVACGSGSDGEGGSDRTPTGGNTINGSITITDTFQVIGIVPGTNPKGDPCFTSTYGGYDDIQVGAQVLVRDASDKIIGTGSLGNGGGVPHGDSAWCAFPFTVDRLPEADFYSIEVTHRKPLTYSRDELEALNWTVDLKLGD